MSIDTAAGSREGNEAGVVDESEADAELEAGSWEEVETTVTSNDAHYR